ncbi:MAG: type IV pilus twitching motility protein PilT [Candidatus Sericytochromatia bacterium]|nr:type IV pilus twitching motility protein PilT [Candidatus Sericytochromatia bacterium]
MAKIDALFKKMLDEGASDLHMSPTNRPRIRKSGRLIEISEAPILTEEMNKALLYEIMSNKERAQYEATHDVDFAYPLDELKVRFRANIYMERKGIGAVFRQIPTEIMSAEQLGLSPLILNFAKLHKGMVLVTGATGSGKSTTLAAMIDYINKYRKAHIITIEDPIEFVHQNQMCLVNQREVGRDTETFASALKSALREDPDVVLVGEMRDLETIELAITAAEMGLLVFGTLHTSSAAKTIDRIINVFPADAQPQVRSALSESLKGVVAQQLLKTVDGKRVAAQELLVGTPAVCNLIREGKTFQIPSQMQTGKKEGMQLMDSAIEDLLKAGRISPEEAYLKATNKQPFERFLTDKSIIHH